MTADPLDVCKCGDFRRSHAGMVGRCCLHRCACASFRLDHDRAEYQRRHPEHYETLLKIQAAFPERETSAAQKPDNCEMSRSGNSAPAGGVGRRRKALRRSENPDEKTYSETEPNFSDVADDGPTAA